MIKVEPPKDYNLMYDEAVKLWTDLQPEFVNMKETILSRCTLTDAEKKSVKVSSNSAICRCAHITETHVNGVCE
eukprot:COSAG02_NODE_2254_length_9348_cov_2.773273_2_plen_74_part_00